MKRIKLLSLFAALALTVTSFAGCSSDSTGDTAEETDSPTADTDVNSEDSNESESNKNTEDEKVSGQRLSVKNIGTISLPKEAKSLNLHTGGAIYTTNDGKYGIISPDGKDTGAIYASCKTLGSYSNPYFEVTTSNAEMSADNLSTINRYGVVDCYGKTIVPQEYAVLSYENGYIKATKATKKTTDKDNYLVFITKSNFAYFGSTSDEDVLFEGTWCLYDANGKKIPGVSGTQGYDISASEEYIEYVDESIMERVKVYPNIKNFPSGATSILNSGGEYAYSGKVYNKNGKELFSFDENEATPNYKYGNYYKASASGKNVVMDDSGKVVSEPFSRILNIIGEYVYSSDNKLYDFDGNQVLDGEYNRIYGAGMEYGIYDAVVFSDGSKYVVCDEEGELCELDADGESVSVNHTSISIKKDGKYYHYSFADKDFTLEGSDIADGLIKSPADGSMYKLIDAATNQTVLDKTYKDFYARGDIENGGYYVYAKKDNGDYDVYYVSK